jgi:hypothetical protein
MGPSGAAVVVVVGATVVVVPAGPDVPAVAPAAAVVATARPGPGGETAAFPGRTRAVAIAQPISRPRPAARTA